MNFDYPVAEVVDVADADQLCTALQQRHRVRLVGGGSSQRYLPAPDQEVDLVSTAAMRRILRLEPDDLTCSVEPGLPRAELDAVLAEHRLWLPCGGDGTLAGIFAGDRLGPMAPAQPEPRSLLLGLSAVLTDGTHFKSGAQVVKNVAGFDLQKLFVGSRGRLFAVTALHLKLRPKPPATAVFTQHGLSLTDAVAQLIGMRRSHSLPHSLCLTRHGATFRLEGAIAGEPELVEQWLSEFGLVAGDSDELAPAPTLADDDSNDETLQGLVPLLTLPRLIEQLPAAAPLRLVGTRFYTRLPMLAADQLLTELPSMGGSGEIVGGTAARRGIRSPTDPVVDRLEADLARALDPRGVLR